jgi:RNA polymerase sigma-70 factor (ECF subfamily)
MAHDWQPDFEQLVDDHQSMVFSLALRMTGDRGLAEEIAQDVFLELDRHLGKIESAVDLWVEIEEMHGALAEDRPSALGSRIEQLLSTLPEAQRAALVLRYQEDLTPEEIAKALEAPVATIKSNLHRGLKLLRAKATSHLKEYIRGV